MGPLNPIEAPLRFNRSDRPRGAYVMVNTQYSCSYYLSRHRNVGSAIDGCLWHGR